MSNLCAMCKIEEKHVCHFFLHCEVARDMWTSFFFNFLGVFWVYAPRCVHPFRCLGNSLEGGAFGKNGIGESLKTPIGLPEEFLRVFAFLSWIGCVF